MTVPYHTHNFEIPIAEKEDILEGTVRNKLIVPASLGTAALAQMTDFASKEQGQKADNAVPGNRLVKAGPGLSGGGALSGDILIELGSDSAAAIAAARLAAENAGTRAESAVNSALDALARAAEADKKAGAAGDVHKVDLGILAFKDQLALLDIAASGAMNDKTVLYGDGVWRQIPTDSGGSEGGGEGDMSRKIYDPRNRRIDVFDMDNMSEGDRHKILSVEEREKLAALPDNAVAATLEITTGEGLSGGGSLENPLILRLSEQSLAALEHGKQAVLKTELGELALKNKITVKDVEADGVCGEKYFLRGDGVWAEPEIEIPKPDPVLPPGMIAPFAANKAPQGWLICDGSAVSRRQYASLFAILGTVYGIGDGSESFNVPDLRGEFIRGFDDERGIDKGRLFGTMQEDAVQDIKGRFSAAGGMLNTDVFTEASGVFRLGMAHLKQRPQSRAVDVEEASPDIEFAISHSARTAAETRPHNLALLYCIKI